LREPRKSSNLGVRQVQWKGSLAMVGRIYSDEKCKLCGSKFKDDGRSGLYCPNHPTEQATTFKVRFDKKLTRRFKIYDEANAFLSHLRVEYSRGKLDLRDYMVKDNPLAFDALVEKYLKSQQKTMRPNGWRKYSYVLNHAAAHFGQRTIKEISPIDLDEYFETLNLAPKTLHDHNCVLKGFWRWVGESFDVEPPRRFPKTKPEMAYKKIVTKEQQISILEEIYKTTWKSNPRVYIAILFLTTYLDVRPGELIEVNEEHINLRTGYMMIPHTKVGKERFIKLLPEDVELLRSLPRGLPGMPFFRYQKGTGGQAPGKRFGKHTLYCAWKRAARTCGILDVDLYRGTRHSSARGLREVAMRTPEEIKGVTGHRTSKAFERYFRLDDADRAGLYADTRKRPAARSGRGAADQLLTNYFSDFEPRKLPDLQGKMVGGERFELSTSAV
jgi:integrase